MQKRVTVKTYKFVLILVALFLCAVIAKLGYVCISKTVDGIDLETFANNRNTITKTLYASRGTIYDSEGEELAQNVNSYTLIAYLSSSRTSDPNKPQHVIDKELTASSLSPIIGMDEASILSRLNKSAYQVEFGTNGKLNEIQKEQVEDLDLPGLDFVISTTRYYKMSTFASYLVGYAKTNDDGEIKGELGIESYYNDTLKGTNGTTTYQQDAYGYKMANVPDYVTESQDGSNIYLTIDSNVQLITENAIKSMVDNYKLDWAIFTVMDAKTGAIVASSTAPTFNPNNLSTISSYLNPLVSYTYEPGSTMKVFSFASAIDSGNYNGSETYKSGSIPVADVVIRDSNRNGWGTISFDTGFAYSSNVAATILARKMGIKVLSNYYQALGFGNITGIELSGEVAGDIDFTYESELATASFGQGITVTPIQMLQALTTITNDGVELKPYLVDKIVDSNGNITYKSSRKELAQVYKKETTDYMKNLMYDVIYNGLSSMWQPNNVTLIGKTGTAQIASPKGGYLSGEYDYIRSLSGIFPKENPKYIIYVATKEMISTKTALANIVTKAVEEIASYAKITTKDETENPVKQYPSINLDNYISNDVSFTVEKLKELGLKVYTIGNGKYIINQYPLRNTKVLANSKVFLLTNSNDYLIPNFTGWSNSEIKTFGNLINHEIKIIGYGYAVSQNINEGTQIMDDMNIEVTLQ